MPKAKLKPCPFCASPAEEREGNEIRCTKCYATVEHPDGLGWAIKRWNSRALICPQCDCQRLAVSMGSDPRDHLIECTNCRHEWTRRL